MSGSHFFFCVRRRLHIDSQQAGALQEVRDVYAELARRPVERNCTLRTECCRFKLTGETPFLTKGEALIAAQAFRASGRTKLAEPTDGSCPLLNPITSKCMIYANRPFACRTHFCSAAGGSYTRSEVLDLIRRLEKVDADLGGWGTCSLPAGMREALRETR